MTVTDPTKPSTLTLPVKSGTSLNVGLPANSLPSAATVTATYITSTSLPKSITRIAHGGTFAANTNNIYVTAFNLSLNPASISLFTVPLNVTGSGLVQSSIPINTTLNLAFLQGEGTANAQWVDVGTFQVGANGSITPNLPSTDLPGLLKPGTYVVYQAATGGTTVANFGIALVGGDNGILSVVNFYDSKGVPLTTPKVTGLPITGSSDLDGQALTPDGSYGVLVDGANLVTVLKGVNAGVPIAAANPIDISTFGGDGDAIAITPNGDTAIVSGDGSTLVTISGIAAGNPKLADTIAIPGSRDGLTISNDGKVLLARGFGGLTVYSVASQTPVVGSLGGMNNFSFTNKKDFPELGISYTEDGRDGMAIDPKDSSKAIVAGQDGSGNPTLTLLTGLPNAPIATTIHLKLPALKGAKRPLKSRHEHKFRPALTLTGVASAYAVSISQDGKFAAVGTDAGIVIVTGVNTGVLAQVGTTSFNPDYSFLETGLSTPQTQALGQVTTLGFTLDNKYIIALSSYGDFSGGGSLLMFPISAAGLGNAVSQVDNIVVPYNDQILIH